jgi:chitin synthase
MIVTLPLPAIITQYLPKALVSALQWFAFWTFAGLLVVPWLLCVYRLATTSLGRTRSIDYILDERSAPKIVVVMPVYKEEPDILLTAINSVVDCEYPPSCIHVFLSFDGDQLDELYLKTVDRLGIPISMKEIPMSIDVVYNGARITVSRFPHGGKRKCQKATFKLIDKIYLEYVTQNDDLFILFIDSDCILDKVCIQNFLYEMELKPGSKHNMMAMTGVITSTTERQSLITLLQDIEYIHGQLYERSVETCCGSVTCLPGALTILRFSAFRNMAKYYFADRAEECDDFFDYGKCHLGEDRWLTHLFMIAATERYQIGMCTNAFCKTEAVQTFRSLLKQRRRWFLGFMTNEVCMLTDTRLWRKYTLLCVIRLMQNTIRTTALLFFIMVISIMTTSNKTKNLPVGFIAVSLGLNYFLMLYFGARIRRFKAWLYPIMFIVNPFFNWLYLVYGVFTAGQRTWGGPRADAGVADAKTTPQQAIEHAEAIGDDLNIIPETFRQAKRLPRRRPTMLQPSGSIEGRFAPSGRLSGRWNKHTANCALPLPAIVRQGRAESFSSVESADSIDFALQTPRFVGPFPAQREAKEDFGRGASSSSEIDVGDGMRPSKMPHAPARPNGLAKPSTLQRYSAPQTAVDSGDRQQLRRSRATILTLQSRGPDPEELHARLAGLPIPLLIHDGSGVVYQSKSPLGRTGPAVYATEEPGDRGRGHDIQSSPSTQEAPRKRGCSRRASSERTRLQKRPPSSGNIV